MDLIEAIEGLHKPVKLIFEASTTLNNDGSNTHEKHLDFKQSVNDIKFSLQSVWLEVNTRLPIGTKELDIDPLAVVYKAFQDKEISITILEEVAAFLSNPDHHGFINSCEADEINAVAQSARDLQEQLAVIA